MQNTEQIIKKMHPSWIGFFSFYFFGIIFVIAGIALFFYNILFGAVAILVAIFIIAIGELSRRAETFSILDSGVAREYKLLSTSRKFVEYDNIQNVEMNQSFFQNMLKIGNLYFDTSGSDEVEVSFHNVKDPYGVEKIVREKMKAR